MKIVVTGGAGFIGANLCRTLLEAGVEEVVAFDDLSTGSVANLTGVGARLIEGTILDRAAVDDTLAGAQTVIHLAARPSVPKSILDPFKSHDVNTTGTAVVLEAIRSIPTLTRPHLIVASSSSVYGTNPFLPKHESLRPMPVSPYAASKLATETYALAWAQSFGMPVLVFRFFNVFGPLQPAGHAYAAVVPAFVSAALAGLPIPIEGDGLQTRDFTFVGSVSDVITDAALRRVIYPGPVNLAFGGRYSLLDLIALLEDLLQHSLERRHGPARAGDVRDSQADQGLLRSLFPRIKQIGLSSGLDRTIEWFRSLS